MIPHLIEWVSERILDCLWYWAQQYKKLKKGTVRKKFVKLVLWKLFELHEFLFVIDPPTE